MASIKVKFRPSAVAGHKGTIYYQIIHDRKPRQLLSKCRIYPSEWDEKRSMVKSACRPDRKLTILTVREHIRYDIERLVKIVRRFEKSGLTYTSDDIVDEFHRYSLEYSVFNYMEGIIIKLRQNGRFRTSEIYLAALNSFRTFRAGKDIMLDSINSDMMIDYEAWHRTRGNCPNTISFYTRVLRAVYNRAVEEDIIDNRHPFRRVYTGIDRTVKRALPLPIVRKIKQLDLSHDPELEYARDMFMLSFYLRGMSFIDMAFLRKSDLSNGYIVYRRHKTGQQLIIEWTTEMQALLDKYPDNPTEYMLPIITTQLADERYTYRSICRSINYQLKKIARSIGLGMPLTLYVARHSWATAAKSKGIPVSVISEGMGHDSEATTQIYLATLDSSTVDRANDLILKSLK